MKKIICLGFMFLVGVSFFIPMAKSYVAEYVPITTIQQQIQVAEYVPITTAISTTHA